jgi:hypothetical protein
MFRTSWVISHVKIVHLFELHRPYRILVGNPEGKGPLVDLGLGWILWGKLHKLCNVDIFLYYLFLLAIRIKYIL